MTILTIIMSSIALLLAAGALYFNMQKMKVLKKFFGDKKIKDEISRDLKEYFEKTKEVFSLTDAMRDEIDTLRRTNQNNFSAFASRRFNPYEESGGDLSFCLVILDREKNGMMITSLHGRDRTRIYTRHIEKGEANLELLYDKKQTLEKALKNKLTVSQHVYSGQ